MVDVRNSLCGDLINLFPSANYRDGRRSSCRHCDLEHDDDDDDDDDVVVVVAVEEMSMRCQPRDDHTSHIPAQSTRIRKQQSLVLARKSNHIPAHATSFGKLQSNKKSLLLAQSNGAFSLKKR